MAVFVAGGKDQIAQMLVDDRVAADARGVGDNDAVVGTAVLRYCHFQVGEGVAHGEAVEVDVEFELLMGGVIIDVGA